MKLITLTTALAILAAPVFAENYQPPQEPETPTKCCDVPAPETLRDTSASDKADIAAVIVGLVGAWIIIDALTDNAVTAEPGPYEIRPTVRPDTCMNKRGVFVACGE